LFSVQSEVLVGGTVVATERAELEKGWREFTLLLEDLPEGEQILRLFVQMFDEKKDAWVPRLGSSLILVEIEVVPPEPTACTTVQNKTFELSAGPQPRGAESRALANTPAIILADESTGNLYTRAGKEIINFLRELNLAKESPSSAPPRTIKCQPRATAFAESLPETSTRSKDDVSQVRNLQAERITGRPSANDLAKICGEVFGEVVCNSLVMKER
jgi:hypothetical protein